MKLEGKKVYIRFLEECDAKLLTELEVRNKSFFQSKLIKNSIMQRKKRFRYLFGVFIKETNELIGKVILSEVLYGPFKSCCIGGYLDLYHNGKGYMTEAVMLSIKFVFDELKLHRIEARAMSNNIGSLSLLKKSGFHKEGLARKNVYINDEWRDLEIWSIILEDK